MKKFTIENLRHVIDYQMELNGYSERFDDLNDIPQWYHQFTTTPEKEGQLREYLKTYFKPFLLKSQIEKEISKFILFYGLRTLGKSESVDHTELAKQLS